MKINYSTLGQIALLGFVISVLNMITYAISDYLIPGSIFSSLAVLIGTIVINVALLIGFGYTTVKIVGKFDIKI
jgi:hypothetical protein